MPPSTFEPFEIFGGQVQRAVMPLLTIVDNQLVPLGTGFTVAADGLMMTAGHVVDQAFRTKTRRLNSEAHFYDHYELYALCATDERHSADSDLLIGGLWPICRVWRHHSLDVAFCYLTHALRDDKPATFPIVRLSPTVPNVGSHVLGLGYYGMVGERITTPAIGGSIVEYSQKTARSSGVVNAVFPVRRDAGMLNFPCFQTDARFDHGMSGGPIFNEKGFVIGVICSSFPASSDADTPISFASLIWPAFGVSIDVALEAGGPSQSVLIHELAKRGIIATDEGLSKLRVGIEATGNAVVTLVT